MPYFFILIIGLFYKNQAFQEISKFDKVGIVLTCYSEGDLIELAIESIAKQTYPLDKMTLFVMIDGGSKYNKPTVNSANKMKLKYDNLDIRIIDKDDRYGRVHSNNYGLRLCQDNSIKYIMILDGDTSISPESVYSFTLRMQNNPKLSGISGSIKVRNLNTSITKLTYLEYCFGIVLSRFSLSKFNFTNNLSGAFSFHDVSRVSSLGGWRSNTAEDLDLTWRYYIHGHCISHESKAVAYTDSPSTLFELCKQRITWSGDIIFLTGLYYKYLTIKNLGFRLWCFLFYNLILTIGIPCVTLIYFIAIFFAYSLSQIFLIILLVYFLYLFVSVILYLLYYFLLCEQKELSEELIIYLPLLPIYSLILRMNDVIAFGMELIFKNHLNSKMAPKDVLITANNESNEKWIKIK